MKWYQLDEEEVFKQLQTSEDGLSEDRAKKLLETHGPNKLPEGKGVSRLKILLHQFTSPLIYILLVAGLVTAVLGEYIDTGVIVAVLILNAVVGYFQEYKAETSIRALKSMVVPKAKVLREGREKEVHSEDLVPGDIVLIPTGFAAIASILTAMALDLPIPYVAAQLLWINLVTNGLQDVALAFEPGEKDVVKKPPRNPKEGIMSRLMYDRTILVGLIISAGVIYNFISALDEGVSLERARTIAVTTMVLFQFFQAWNCRSELESVFRINPLSNPFLFYSMVAAFLAQIAVIYLPALQWVFRTEALSLADWVKIGLVALTVVIAVEVDKAIRRYGRD